ncbi:membrane protein [Streptomyces phage LuckySocke]|nr:membrane protein [Streptomyces phage LuckySocke]
MKKTGDAELDFLREAGSEALNLQAKAYYKYVAPGEAVALAILVGIIWLMSSTVALWVLTILGSLLLIQFLLVSFMQLRARHALKKHTKSQDALNAATRGFFE